MADSTQFLIDIATRLTGGDAAIASLGNLGEKMTAAGASAAQLDAAVSAAAQAVKDSGAAAQAAADAVSAGAARYAEAESAADKAAKAVERIGAAAEAQRGKLQAALDAGDASGAERAGAKLAQLMQRQDEAAAKAQATAAALEQEGAALDRLKADAGAAASEHESLSASLDGLESAANDAAKAEKKAADAAAGSGKVNEMSEALGKLGGPLGHIGQKALGAVDGLKKLSGSMGSAVGMAAAATVAVAALVVGIVAGTVAIVSWAIGLADAARTSSLLSAGIAGTVEGGKALDATISKLASRVPIAADELQKMAADLAKGGKKGQELTGALEEAAVKAAKLKYGPEYAKQLLSLDSQAAKLKRSLQGTFGGLNIEGALGGLDRMGSLLDSNTESGKVLKMAFEGIFQPLVDKIGAAAVPAEALFLGIEIGALQAYIAMKPLLSAFGLLDTSAGSAEQSAAAMKNLGETIGMVAAVAAVVLYALAWPFLKIAEGIGAAIELSQLLGAAIKSGIGAAVDWLSGLSLGSIGSDLINGLANGITGSAGKIIDAITGAVGGAISAAKQLLGIASPSKVFEEIGGYTAEGYTGGVEDGAPDAQAATEALVNPPTATATRGAGAGAQAITINMPITINGRGVDDDGLVAKIEEAGTRMLERLAMQLGAANA